QLPSIRMCPGKLSTQCACGLVELRVLFICWHDGLACYCQQYDTKNARISEPILKHHKEKTMPSNSRQAIYLALAIVGLCSTWYFNIQFMMQHGSDIRDFIAAVTLNDAARSIAADIGIIAFAFLIWSFHEARKL